MHQAPQLLMPLVRDAQEDGRDLVRLLIELYPAGALETLRDAPVAVLSRLGAEDLLPLLEVEDAQMRLAAIALQGSILAAQSGTTSPRQAEAARARGR
jgi:hypothetical protein